MGGGRRLVVMGGRMKGEGKGVREGVCHLRVAVMMATGGGEGGDTSDGDGVACLSWCK